MATEKRWELNGTTLEYKVDGTTVAKLATANLQDAAKEIDDTTGAIDGITVTGSGTTDDPYVFELSSTVLNEKTVKLTTVKGYSSKLAIAEDDQVEIGTPNFNLDKLKSDGKVTVTADFGAGYTLKSNTEINYSAAKEAQVLATVSGLKKGDDDAAEGISFSTDGTQIILDRSALGTGKVSIALSNGGSYTLNLTEDAKAHENIDKWAVSGNNATYKNVTPEYYSVNTKGEVIYNKEADVKVYAALTGVASGLKVSENGQFLYAGDTEDEENAAIYFDADNAKLIHLTRDALTTKNIAFNTKAKLLVDDHLDYSLTFGEGGENYAATIVPESGAWTVKSGTATYKANLTTGYTLATGNRAVTYIKATKNSVLAEVKGLNKTLTSTDNAIAWENESTENGEIGEGTITLLPAAFTNSSVTVTKGNYTLDLDDDVVTKDNVGTENLFSYDNKKGTATYDQYTFDHYDLSDTAKVTVYTAYGKTDTLATLEGLSKNLELSVKKDDAGNVVKKGETINLKKTTADEDDIVAVSANDSDEPTISLGATALDGKNVKLTSTDYTIAEIADENIEQPTPTYKWQLNGEVAYLKKITTAGYSLSGTAMTLNYSEEKAISTVATINGINSNLVVGTVGEGEDAVTALGTYDADGEFVPAVTVDTDEKIVTLTKDALIGKGVTVTGEEVKDGETIATRYQLALADASGKDDGTKYITANEYTKAWKVSNSGAALVEYTPASWSQVATKGKGKDTNTYCYEISYKGVNYGDILATVTGLASGLSANKDDGQINGITVEDNTITLSNNVLNKGDVTIENNGENNYTLALNDVEDSAGYVKERLTYDNESKTKYDEKKLTFTYTEIFTTGYKVEDDGNIIYRAASTDTTTITNVNGALEQTVDEKTGERIFALSMNDIATDKNGKQLDVKLTTKGKYNTDYKLYLNDPEDAIDTYYVWKKTAKDAKATFNSIKSGYMLSSDGKTIAYSSESKPVVLATISGLKKEDVVAADDEDDKEIRSKIKGISLAEDGTTITLDKSVLGDGPVTLGKNDKYTLAIDVEDCKAKDVTSLLEFDKKKGTLTISKGTTKGWRINESDPKTIVYEKPKLTTLASISGLPKTFEVNGATKTFEVVDQSLYVVDVETGERGEKVLTVTAPTDTKSGVITVTQDLFDAGTDVVVKETSKGADDAILGVKKLAIGAKNNYVFEFAEGVNIPKEDDDKVLSASKGTVTYTVPMDDGYTLSSDGKTITYTAATTATLATIKGLNANVGGTKEETAIDVDDAVEINGNVITLKADALTGVTKEVKLTGDGYTMALYEGDATDEYAGKVQQPTPLDEPIWSAKGTTATLKEGTSAGYSVANGGKSITYTAAKEGDTVATITGLSKDLVKKYYNAETGAISGINVYKGLKTICLEDNVLGTTDVKLTSTVYEIDSDNVKAPAKSQAIWTTNKGTATLKQTTEAGFTLSDDKRTLTYTAAKKDATLVTVSGLDKTFDISQDESVITNDGNVIIIGNAALGTSKVAIKEKNSPYSLKLGNDVVQKSEEDVTAWVTSGTTATYKTYNTEYYSIDDKGAIIYNKPEDKEIKATISGIVSGSVIEEDALNETTKVITISKDILNEKKVTLKDNKGAGYTLAIGRGAEKVEVSNDSWEIKNTTATLKGDLSKGYSLSADKKTINYSVAKTGQKLATVSGIAKDVVDISSCVKGNVITLGSGELTTSNVSLKVSAGNDYTLAVDYDDTDADFDYDNAEEGQITHVVTRSAAWNTGSTTAKLTGKVTAGYTLSNDGKSIAYSKASDKATLATVTGLKSKDVNLEAAKVADLSTNTISLKAEHLSSTVSVSGSYKFDIASDYNKGTITGSKEDDDITVHGFNVSVNGGKGNDFVDLGSGTRSLQDGNTFVYGSGDGNDVIANFTTSDIVSLTNKNATYSLSVSGKDCILKTGGNTITLKNAASNATVLIAQNGTTTQHTVASADLLYDDADNFITGDSQLGDITNDAFSAYSLDEDLTSAQNLKTLTKQSTLVTYGSDEK